MHDVQPYTSRSARAQESEEKAPTEKSRARDPGSGAGRRVEDMGTASCLFSVFEKSWKVSPGGDEKGGDWEMGLKKNKLLTYLERRSEKDKGCGSVSLTPPY